MSERVEWSGSQLVAPGPGKDGRLLGTVVKVIESDSNSIKIRWDNDRVTVERRANLRFNPEEATQS